MTFIPLPGVGQPTDSIATSPTQASATLVALTRLVASYTERSGNLANISVTLTRPADTVAYTANDAISDSTSTPAILTFTNALRVAGGTGYLTRAKLQTNQTANVSQFRLHLFHTAPTAINDNAPYTLLWANRASRIGYIDFDAMQTEGTGSDSAISLWRQTLPIIGGAGRDIYGMLETKLGFTPASAQQFLIELTLDQN